MMTTVRCSLKMTKNLGNYENIQVGVEIEDDVRQGETASKAVDRVFELCEIKLTEEVTKAVRELG